VPIAIEEAREVSPELVEAFARLLPQLSSAPPPGEAELEAILASDCVTLLLARDGDAIVGTLTLALFPIPSGVRAWIEDVVVDERARGGGVGELLTRAALELARRRGARTVDLTSRAGREAANRLYERVGFERRETNVFRYTLE
jgi:ribosomal protein S18 acetylase RimI-like enzyme